MPRATYRIQFSPEFGFSEARDIVSYLSKLGVSHLYASPIFAARKGSCHGYDIVDPNRLNPVLGTVDDFDALIGELHRSGLLYIQDIVPNHLAYDSDNWMLMDLLEAETTPIFHSFFDIQWTGEEGRGMGRVLAPFLARPYHECLADGEIRLTLDEAGLGVTCSDTRLPLRIGSYPHVLGYGLALSSPDDPGGGALQPLVEIIRTLETLLTSTGVSDHCEAIPRIKQQLWKLYRTFDEVRDHIDETLETFNRSGVLPGRNLLDDLLSGQRYKLAQRKGTSDEINYRRFFTLNTLISVNMQYAQVFEYLHRLTLELVDAGKISGLRIDHIDGLHDPAAYLEALRARARDAYVVVEKILSPGEDLPAGWQAQGTTGYDFLNRLNGLFCDSTGATEFSKLFRNFTAVTDPCEDIVYESKRFIVEHYMRSETSILTTLTRKVSITLGAAIRVTDDELRVALIEVLACFPVYRTYGNSEGISEQDAERWETAIEQAKLRRPDLGMAIEGLKTLLGRYSNDYGSRIADVLLGHYFMRLQQYTAPVMAKGFEDTSFYRYNRLISLNEVGGNPGQFGVSLEEFHEFNEKRRASWPSSMSTTSTHDTKRGEDARARINVLSEMPAEWEARVNAWRAMNRQHTFRCKSRATPDANLEYLLYQSLVGAWPFDSSDFEGFVSRMKTFAVKAAREAKTRTSWDHPDACSEKAVEGFVERILQVSEANAFLRDFEKFEKKISHYGILNSLSQTLLKIAAPGVPDIYQGSELWDLNLVDPDNRRPVDFGMRAAHLDSITEAYLEDPLRTIEDLLSCPEDGRAKLFLTHRGLLARKENIAILSRGSYIPIESSGELSRHVVAFARSHDTGTALDVAPRFLTGVVEPDEMPLGDKAWGNTEILLPGTPASGPVASRWQDAITGGVLATEGTLRLAEVLKHFPVALLFSKEGSR